MKVSRSVGFLSKLRHYLNNKTLISVYYALIDSHINYCLQTLGYLTEQSWNKLEVLQNKALRIINFKPFRHSAKPLYIRSSILPIKRQLSLKNCLFGYDFVNKKLPSYFNSFSSFMNENDHVTRSSPLRMDTPETISVKYGTYNIVSNVVRDWNKYHHKLKIKDLKKISKNTFKEHLHRYLLTEYAED